MSSQESQESNDHPNGSGMPPPFDGSASPLEFKDPTCPTCKRRMFVKSVAPVLFASGVDDVVYGCKKCGAEAKRSVKRS